MSRSLFLLAMISILVAAPRPGVADANQTEAQAWYDAIVGAAPVTKAALEAGERKALLDELAGHKVASLAQLPKYDPPPGETGFCFGRAMAAHLMARRRGLADESVRKLFIVGDMGGWRFHVTALVRGEDSAWYAIDPIVKDLGFETPLPAARWIEIVRGRWDPEKKCRLYLTDAFTVLPDIRVVHARAFETGEYLFEVKFDPAGKAGFSPITLGGSSPAVVHAVSLEAQKRFFLRTRDSAAADRFPFLRLEMRILRGPQTATRLFDFRNYFVDLLDDLRQPATGGTPHDGLVSLGTSRAEENLYGMPAELFD